MRLIEAVPAEGLDLGGDLLDRFARVPSGDGALGEPPQLLLDQLLVLLAHCFPQDVGFREREAREDVGDPHHLLLVGDDPVGRGEDLLEGGVRILHRLAAQLAVDEHEMHAGVERPGPEQRVRRHEVVEPVALHVAEAVGGERRLELEDARGAARPQQCVDLRVLEVEPVDVDGDAVPLPDHGDGVVDYGEGLQP